MNSLTTIPQSIALSITPQGHPPVKVGSVMEKDTVWLRKKTEANHINSRIGSVDEGWQLGVEVGAEEHGGEDRLSNSIGMGWVHNYKEEQDTD